MAYALEWLYVLRRWKDGKCLTFKPGAPGGPGGQTQGSGVGSMSAGTTGH